MILIENTFDNIKYKFRAQRKLDERNTSNKFIYIYINEKAVRILSHIRYVKFHF